MNIIISRSHHRITKDSEYIKAHCAGCVSKRTYMKYVRSNLRTEVRPSFFSTRTYTYVSSFLYVRFFLCAYICFYIHTYVHMFIRMYTRACTHLSFLVRTYGVSYVSTFLRRVGRNRIE